MALIAWKQISPHFSGSGNLTGSLNVLGNITVNGTEVALSSVSGAYATVEGGNNFTGSQNVLGDVNIDGILTAREYRTELVSASVLYESGSSLFGNTLDDTHLFTGSVYITGSLLTDGATVSFDNHPWPVLGEEHHIVKTQPYSIVFNGVTRSFDYMGLALEHESGSNEYYHNSIKLYTYDSHTNPQFGAELNIGPVRSHLQQYASGSDNLGNISFQEIYDGKVRGLLYANELEIGAYLGEKIRIGNASASIAATGSFTMELNGVDQYFDVIIGGASQVKVTEEGTLQLASKDIAPTAVTGGIFYSSSDDYYLGFTV